MNLEFHPRAQEELRRLATWYEERVLGLGSDLRDEIWRALSAIVERPGRWPLSTIAQARAIGIRQFVLHRFPVTVYYRTESGRIGIIAVAHTARRPGYWLGRMKPRRG